MRVTLCVLLALTALLHLVEGVSSIADPAGMMSGLGLTMAAGVEVPITFLGVSMLVRSAVAALALAWLAQNKREGVFMARFVAMTILLSAPIVFVKLPQPQFAFGDLAHGLLLLVPAMLVRVPTTSAA